MKLINKKISANFARVYLLGIRIRKRKLRIAPGNVRMFFEGKKYFEKQKIDIIVPVYNAYEYLAPLFDSVMKNTDLEYRLIVVHDCSSDARVNPLLEKYQDIFKSRMILLQNDTNLGFVKSVNRALRSTENHVIILNTDAVVPRGWTSRLMRPIFEDRNVASVTPFSNAATIFSLPLIFRNNVFDGNLESVNKKLSGLNIPYQSLRFSTGVGFCMGINKNALREIGIFDEIFAKGYCEEVDWCQRAVKAGYFNTIAGDLFVWHKHGASFGSVEKQKLQDKHAEIILERYPDYTQRTLEILKNDRHKVLRFIAELFYFQALDNKKRDAVRINIKGGRLFYSYDGHENSLSFEKAEDARELFSYIENN
ncbi:MAG: glycosyltransferase [Alphaproteobacteria bacterium]|nr:glycosyltransferase [Alphaproteobacteria bacterium]